MKTPSRNSKKRRSKKPFRFELPDHDDSCAFADWVEVMMLLSETEQVSSVKLAEQVAGFTGSTLQDLETPIGFLLAEIERRRQIAGIGYPLVVEHNLIKFDKTSNYEFYKFLLLIALDGPMRKEDRYNEIDCVFDEIVGRAAQQYFGQDTQTLRFGWPPSGGRPAKFDQAMDWLSSKTGIPLGSGKCTSSDKDGGIDVVVWKPFTDSRPAFFIGFIQCTVQTKWHPKGKDLLPDVLRGYLDVSKDPTTLLAVPFVIKKNYERWDNLRRMVHIVFDRLRLAQLLATCDHAEFSEMKQWADKEISRYAI